jgi:putative transposase
MDEAHFRVGLAYVELNPVRAGMVSQAAEHVWSSARAHLGAERYPEWLDPRPFSARYTPEEWRCVLHVPLTAQEVAEIRCATRLNAVLGPKEFVQTLEQQYQRTLTRKPPGRPRKTRTQSAATGA